MKRILLLLVLLVPRQDKEAEAKKLLDQVAALQEQEKFLDAQALYRSIAKRFPETKAGKEAATRGADNAVLLWRADTIHGRDENRVCFVMTGDGYLIDKQEILKQDMNQLIENFRTGNSTTKEYFSYFNFYRMYASSAVSKLGGDSVFKGKRYGAYAESDLTIVNDLCVAHLPEMDSIPLIMFWEDRGAGHVIAEVAGSKAEPVMHVMGHSPFMGLADENMGHYTDGPNASFKPDLESCPWRHWFKDPDLAKAAGVGIYEIGDGKLKKWIPTQSNCTMAAGGMDWCPVCREQFMLALYRRISPIDEASPEGWIKLGPKDATELIVVPMKPLTHELKVEWRVRKLNKAPKKPVDFGSTPGETVTVVKKVHVRRRSPGSADLIELRGDVVKSKRRVDKSGRAVDFVVLRDLALKPGFYELIVSVKDEPASTMKGRRVPWVVADPDKLLEERLKWTLEVTE